jgi:hypothetical protein
MPKLRGGSCDESSYVNQPFSDSSYPRGRRRCPGNRSFDTNDGGKSFADSAQAGGYGDASSALVSEPYMVVLLPACRGVNGLFAVLPSRERRKRGVPLARMYLYGVIRRAFIGLVYAIVRKVLASSILALFMSGFCLCLDLRDILVADR